MGTLLIIDDSELIRNEIKEAVIKASLFDKVLEATDGIEGFKLLVNNNVDLVVCDVVMPSIDGFKFLDMMKARKEYIDLPVIILTGENRMDKKIEGLDKGASDYLTKPFHQGELLARIRVQTKIKSLQDELKKSNELLKYLSNTDALTKLHNRRYIMELLESEFARAERYGNLLSILMLDIDKFKNINDTYGHQIGDAILSEIGEMLLEIKRTSDLPGRYGGEEFIMIVPQTSLNAAYTLAERIRKKVENHPFKDSKGKKIPVTISIGVAAYPSVDIDTTARLIKKADVALYEAKEAGRNKVLAAEQINEDSQKVV